MVRVYHIGEYSCFYVVNLLLRSSPLFSALPCTQQTDEQTDWRLTDGRTAMITSPSGAINDTAKERHSRIHHYYLVASPRWHNNTLTTVWNWLPDYQTFLHIDSRHLKMPPENISRVSTLPCDIDIAILSVCLSVRPLRSGILQGNGLIYRHSFFTSW